jgi:hypothetical protein
MDFSETSATFLDFDLLFCFAQTIPSLQRRFWHGPPDSCDDVSGCLEVLPVLHAELWVDDRDVEVENLVPQELLLHFRYG